MKIEEFIKKLGVALEDDDTAKALEAFGVTPEQIEEFKDLTVPSNLEEALKIKGVQSEFDKKLKKAADTREAKLKKRFGFGEEEEEEMEEEEEIETKDPAVKLMLKELKEMRAWRKEQEENKQQETVAQKTQKARDFLKSKGILPGYASELDLEKDFEEQFETVKEKFEADGGTIVTEVVTNPRHQRIPVPQNGGAKKPSKEEIADIVR